MVTNTDIEVIITNHTNRTSLTALIDLTALTDLTVLTDLTTLHKKVV